MRFIWLLAAFCWILAIQPARSDTVILASGGKLQGSLEDSPGDPDAPRRVVSPQGMIEIAPDLIIDVEREPPALTEYRDRARQAGMTLVDQWELVKWCRLNGLYDESHYHCEQILKLDPDHAAARNMLGYQLRGGEWMQRDDYMHSRGFVHFDGRWRTHQQVQLLEERRLIRAGQVQWWLKLKRWRESLGTPRQEDNEINFELIRDPLAMVGLIRLLGREDNIKLQRTYVETLGNLDGQAALGFLMDNSVYQNNPEHREMCLIAVLKHRHPQMIEYYARFLTWYDRGMVNRAGECLGALEYPSAVIPLASALQTRDFITNEESGNNIYHYSHFPPTRRFDINGPLPTYRKKTVEEIMENSQSDLGPVWDNNVGVYEALRNLTDRSDFGFNAAAWKGWYTQQQVMATPVIQGRRGN